MKQTMLEHVKTHTSEKNHKCEIYNKFFIAKQNMLKHVEASVKGVTNVMFAADFSEQVKLQHCSIEEKKRRKFSYSLQGTDNIDKRLVEKLTNTFQEMEQLQIDNGSVIENHQRLEMKLIDAVVTKDEPKFSEILDLREKFVIIIEENVIRPYTYNL